MTHVEPILDKRLAVTPTAEQQSTFVGRPVPPFSPEQFPDNWSEPGEMHFRLSDANMGDLDLTCSGGYVLSSYDLGQIQVREVVYPNTLDKGTIDLTRWFGNRAVTLDLVLKPHTGTGPSSQWIGSESWIRDRLLAFTTPMIRPTLIFTEHQDTRVKKALLRGTGASIAVEKANYNKLTASWIIPSGVYESYYEHCYTYRFATATADSLSLNVYNYGSGRSHWRAYLTGEAIKPRFLLDGGSPLQLDYSANPGDQIYINPFDRTVEINGNPTGYRYIPDNANWFLIPPGLHTLTIEHDTYTQSGYPAAFWQPEPRDTRWTDQPFDQPGEAPPPWAWTTRKDPTTGEPGIFQVVFCFNDTYL